VGNLIVGYNEMRTQGGNYRSGSHNIVGGRRRNFSSFGGFVVGDINSVSGPWSSVSGDSTNTASGNFASVSGGDRNVTGGRFASVLGGRQNKASGANATVSGGSGRSASDENDWVAGSLLEDE
jgi:hypothetical protein